jgi:hypothetical protein
LNPKSWHNENSLTVAYVFAFAMITSLCIYWCAQRYLFGFMREVMKAENHNPAMREVEDFFVELQGNMFPRALLPTGKQQALYSSFSRLVLRVWHSIN